jgi:hypothetical protein
MVAAVDWHGLKQESSSRRPGERLATLAAVMETLLPRLELRREREEAIRSNGKGTKAWCSPAAAACTARQEYDLANARLEHPGAARPRSGNRAGAPCPLRHRHDLTQIAAIPVRSRCSGS